MIVNLDPKLLKENPYSRKMIPEIDKDARQVLKKSIEDEGVRDAIEVDEDYVILNGHERTVIALELGLPLVPVEVVKGLSEDEKKERVIIRNLDRKHFEIGTRAMLGAELATLTKTEGRPSLSDKLDESEARKGSSLQFSEAVTAAGAPIPISAESIAKEVGVDTATLYRAKAIRDSEKIPEDLKFLVRRGHLPIRPVSELENESPEFIKKVTDIVTHGGSVTKAIHDLKYPKAIRDTWNEERDVCPVCGNSMSKRKHDSLRKKFERFAGLFS